ncbi:hypothetical protein AVEN_22080-1 [Araneus ventricosus]|uniref:Uncharacterized protein n=1 Tax=Araneus ventricosus TaxID=182803 RepID=A0A4Y2T6W5_ARAVE|nr:hypothetical protein AVEN_22080-1 [Araneus ventricosus]
MSWVWRFIGYGTLSANPRRGNTRIRHLDGSKKNLSLHLRRYGQGLHQAKNPPKEKLPVTEVVNKSPRKIFKGWQTRKSLSSLIPDPSGSAMPERKPLQFLLHPPFFNAKNALRQTINKTLVTPTKASQYAVSKPSLSYSVGGRDNHPRWKGE